MKKYFYVIVLLLSLNLFFTSCGPHKSAHTNSDDEMVEPHATPVSVIQRNAKYFKTVGQLTSFQWAPDFYSQGHIKNPFFYDIFYYIPKSLSNQKDVPALIFNHGGGASTMDRDGSIRTVKLYTNDLVKIADQLGVIVVLPSANGLNWGSHTVGMLKDLLAVMRKELLVNSNRIGLSGHSMGGMGITRAYSSLADEFAFFMPVAAGMDFTNKTEDVIEAQINKVFNVPYVHIQGLRDHFTVFIDRCKEQLARTQNLEKKYQANSKFNLIFTYTDHNYNFAQYRDELKKAFANYSRDLYQKNLWGTVGTSQYISSVENNINFYRKWVNRYFWIQALEKDLAQPDSMNFLAKIINNQIQLVVTKKPTRFNQVRVYFTSKMVDFSKPVEFYVNGKLVRKVTPVKVLKAGSISTTDSNFIFENYADITVSN